VLATASNRLPDDVRLTRLALCAACEFNKDGSCSKCLRCGGRKIDFKIVALTETCPLTPPKWGSWIQLKK
jgi:hypothetical protein